MRFIVYNFYLKHLRICIFLAYIVAQPASVLLDTLLVRNYNHQNEKSQLKQHLPHATLLPPCDSLANFKISLLITIEVFQNTYFPDTCMILNTCCWFENDFPIEILIALSILDASWYMMRPASSAPLYGTSMWGKTPWIWRHDFVPVK